MIFCNSTQRKSLNIILFLLRYTNVCTTIHFYIAAVSLHNHFKIMKNPIFLCIAISMALTSCLRIDMPDMEDQLICEEYWAQIDFSQFCGLSPDNFQYNESESDICNADQNSTYPFDDFVSIRVFNYFANEDARDEFENEKDFFGTEEGFREIDNIGDDAFATIVNAFGELDQARLMFIKGTFGVFIDINGKASNGANNCFNEALVLEFARELAAPL